MMGPLLLILVLCSCVTGIRSQCLTQNDTVDETTTGDVTRALLDSSLSFSIEMFRTLNGVQQPDTSPGLFFSPFSIWSALMITYMGSRGRTEQEMYNVLRLVDFNKAALWAGFRNLQGSYQNKVDQGDRKNSYKTANRLYFQQGAVFRQCMQDYFAGDLEAVDFQGDPEGARQLINKWVEDQTEQKITDLIPPGVISGLTKVAIANAVYFKDTWKQQFDLKNTRIRRFTLESREDVMVPMMSMNGRFLYGISEDLQCTALELPYSGNDLSMVILLPQNRFYGVDIMTRLLMPQRLKMLLDDMYPREALVVMPKFRMEDSFELSQALSNMGMRTLFDATRVDLSGFTGDRDLLVDTVRHKSYIDVNEEGTDAAAATGILESRVARPIGPASFIADRPFIFLIRDNFSNVLLFMGTVRQPKL